MDRFVDGTQIGRGGFGRVTRCTDTLDGCQYAKKSMTESSDEEANQRFIREVKLLKSLRHSNVVDVIEVNVTHPPFYYIMPLYNHTLESELDKISNDTARIAPIFNAILNAVEHAHSNEIIHRDLKPANVLMNSDDDIVVSDFGLGRNIVSDSTRNTASGYGMGTYLYMPPEQHRDFKNVDERADIYALGIILYMLHNGDATYLDPSRYPSNIRHVIKTAVQPEKDNRYRTVNELRKAWHEATSQIVTISIAEQVQQITKSFAESSNNILPSPLDRLHHLLTLYQDDGRLLHDGFMGLVPLAFRLYGSRWSEDLPVLIKKFVTYTTSHTTWKFIYIDEICNRCRSWYVVSDDIDIKADLVCCVFELAYKHDRHISIRIFLAVIQMPKIPGEGQAIADRLGRLASLQPGWVTEASERLTPSRLEANIRAFFCPSDPMGEV